MLNIRGKAHACPCRVHICYIHESLTRLHTAQHLSQVGPRLVGLEEAMAAHGLLKSEVFHDPSSDTKMLMAWNKTMLICTFRGTDSWANARSDIQVCIVCVVLRLRQAVPLTLTRCFYKSCA